MPLSSRIANKASNLILVPFGPWLKLFTPLAAALGKCYGLAARWPVGRYVI